MERERVLMYTTSTRKKYLTFSHCDGLLRGRTACLEVLLSVYRAFLCRSITRRLSTLHLCESWRILLYLSTIFLRTECRRVCLMLYCSSLAF